MKDKLTNALVKRTEPKDKSFTVWDMQLSGFGLRVLPSGSKSFIVRYRANGGGRGAPERLMTLGKATTLGADIARKMASEALASVRLGGDPAADKTNRRRDPTINDILDRYISEHVEIRNKAKTAEDAKRHVEQDVRPALGKTRLKDLTRAQIKEWHLSFRDRPYAGNRSLAYLRKALSLAEKDWEIIDRNPAMGIALHPEKRRDRVLNEQELARLGQALTRLETAARFPVGAVRAVWLLSLTGMRLGEVLSLEWRNINVAGQVATLADAKTQNSLIVPLGGEASAYLRGLDHNGPFVCPSFDSEQQLPIKRFRAFFRILRKEADLDDVRPHDLRHTFATVAAGSGHSAFMIRDLLRHTDVAMSSRYVSRQTAPLIEASSVVSSRIAGAMRVDKVK